MTVMERLANSIVVPVVVLDKVEDAIPTAKAMAAGGVDTMEITFRTALLKSGGDPSVFFSTVICWFFIALILFTLLGGRIKGLLFKKKAAR